MWMCLVGLMLVLVSHFRASSYFIVLLTLYSGEAVLAEEDSSIQMHSNVVVCMGAPRTGLLNAMRNAWGSWTLDVKTGESQSTADEGLLALKVYVVDIGISETWKSYGEQLELAPGPGPEFGMKWFLSLKLEEEIEEEEEEEEEDEEEDDEEEE